MLSNYNFNLNPYYDDFDGKKNFYRILFKPGFAVQARELTQLQTGLQDQISKFGDHIFKEGSVVLGGNFSSKLINYINVSRNNAITNFDGQVFTGQTSGAIGKVVKTEAIDVDTARIYFTYVNGLTFVKNETVVCDNNNTEITENNNAYLGTATAFSVDEGVFYIYGNFVYCEPQTAIIAIDGAATSRVGLLAEEVIINSNQDTTLLDPALGSYNYSAPGADRYTITLNLISYAFDPANDAADENASRNFIELARFVNGLQTTINRRPFYSELEDTLARRTYDESGDYTVRSFGIKIKDHIYGNTDLLSLEVEPGKAYVKGYEFETVAPTYLDLPRSRTTNFENEFPLYINYGQYFYTRDYKNGVIDFTSNPTVNLLDSNTSTSNVIGNCVVKYIDYESANTFKLYIDSVNIFDTANIAVSDIRAFNTATFNANVAMELYPVSGTEIVSTDNPSYIIKVPKDYVASMNAAETSYTTLSTLANTSFTSNGTVATVTITNPATAQRFLGTGLLTASDTRSLFTVIVTSSANTTVLPVGVILDPSTNGLKVTVTSESTIDVSVSTSVNFTAVVTAKVGISDATVRTKTLATSNIVISGASLTSANLSNVISLGKSDCIELSSVVAYNVSGFGYDYTSRYDLDTGQTDVLYDHGSITLKSGYTDPVADGICNTTTGNVTVSFSYYTHSAISGSTFGFFNLNSYPNYDSIPSYTTSTGTLFNLRDCLDFRPRRVDNSTTISGSLLAEPGSILTTDFENYIGRIDKLVLTKERKLTLLQGVPSENPSVPVDIPDSMGLYILTVPPYTQFSKDVTFTYIENKRYTMRDIGMIEKRVERLEYYTSLSLLEKQAKDESIPSDIPTIDRFKNGILVDSFAGHSVGDVSNPDYACSIDYVNRIMRPRFKSDSYTFKLNTGTGYKKNGNLITLNYTANTFINQPLVSRTVNLNPYDVFVWNGYVELNPASDTWFDTTVLPDVIVNLNGENDIYTNLANNTNNPAGVGVRFADWQTVSKGVSKTTNQMSTSGAVSNSKDTKTTTSVTQTATVTTQLNNVGLNISTGGIQTVTREIGTKIVDVSIAPYIRSRIVDFSGKALKPQTQLYATFDGVDISSYCSPATEIILASGNTVSNTAQSISLYTGNTNVSGVIVARRSDRIFVKEVTNTSVNSSIRFATNKPVYWVTGNVVNSTPVYVSSIIRRDSLTTNEKGDIAGSFVIPNSDVLRFRTGEKEFRLSDSLQPYGTSTSAASKYVAQGMSQSVAAVILEYANTSTPTPPPPPPNPTPVPCAYNDNGGKQGVFTYTLQLGSNTGIAGISYDAMSTIPDRFTIIWDGTEYTTGFVGGNGYNSELNKLGYPSVVGPRTGSLTFNKTKETPTTALLRIDAPLKGTGWKYSVICPSANVTPPQPVTTGTINLALSHAATTTFGFAERNTSTLKTQLKMTVSTTGTNAKFVRVSDLQVVSVTDANGTSLPTSTVTLDTSTRDFEIKSKSNGSKSDEKHVDVTLNKPAKNGSKYTVTFSGIARVYNTSAERTSGLNVVLTSNTAFTTATIIRDDSFGFRIDPVAQTFFVDENRYPNGIFLDSIDLFFKTKSSRLPVTVELRPTVNGYPSSKDIIPFSVVNKMPEDVVVSDNASLATNFKFVSPVYLAPGEYSFVAKCNTNEYSIYTAVLGDFLLNDPNTRITSQPAVGSMFKSQNSSTWTAVQEEDVMFRLNQCLFDTTTAADVQLYTNYPTLGNTEFDLLFVDGEHLDFAATNVDYFYKTTKADTLVTDASWNQYQIGSNVNLPDRKIIRSLSDTDLQFRTVMTTTDPNISPAIDLDRLSGVMVQNIINNDANNCIATYITRKVTLAPNFESLDLKTYFLANLPTGTSVKVYCKVAPITSVSFDTEPWREMTLESSGNPSETGFVDYKYKTPNDTALPSGDRFKTFAIRIDMFSSNPTHVPQFRDLRVIALDD